MKGSQVDRQSSLELLNATHTFPCEFTLKIIGKSTEDFADRCAAAVNSVLPTAQDIPVSLRSTPNGRHTSVTLLPKLSSAEQVLEVYECIKQVDGVVMTM